MGFYDLLTGAAHPNATKAPETTKADPDEGKQYLVVGGIYRDVDDSRNTYYAEAEKRAEYLTERGNESYRIYVLVAVVEPDMFVKVRRVDIPEDVDQ